MGKQIKVIARIEEEQKLALYPRLRAEHLSFSAWLRRQIDAYLAGTEVKTVASRSRKPRVSPSKTHKGEKR
jgi:hypothetical protein